jgi:secreted trypsin-like serine protease
MVAIKSQEVNVYVEYLDNMSLVNLITTTRDQLIESFQVEDDSLTLKLENEAQTALKINFVEFKAVKTSAKMTKNNAPTKDGSFETIIRFQVLKSDESLTNSAELKIETIKEITKLKCLSCQQSILNDSNLTKNPE